jgi:hypothetical protein
MMRMVAGGCEVAVAVDWASIEGEVWQAISARLKQMKTIPKRRNLVRVDAIVQG